MENVRGWAQRHHLRRGAKGAVAMMSGTWGQAHSRPTVSSTYHNNRSQQVLLNCTKFNFGLGFAPDPIGEAHNAHTYP